MVTITTTDDVRLNVIERGDPTGRPVVFVAGFKAPATSWRFQFPAFEDAGHRVLALDRRGHGDSETPDHGHDMDRHGADVHDLLEDHDLRDVTVIGGSMGGNAIWALVDQFGTERIRDIVIVDQTPKMLNTPDWPHGFYDYEEPDRDTAFADGIPDPGRVSMGSKGPVRIVRLLRALNVLKSGLPRSFTAAELALLNDHATRDWREVIADLDVPALFVAGRESEYWPWTHARAAADLTPLATWAVIRDDGHAANIEQPAAFNAGVLRFLRRSGRDRSEEPGTAR